jgi:hypothetical protein
MIHLTGTLYGHGSSADRKIGESILYQGVLLLYQIFIFLFSAQPQIGRAPLEIPHDRSEKPGPVKTE